MNKMHKSDRRRFIRLKAHHLVKYRAVSGENGSSPLVLATIKDIGANGICMRTEEFLPISSVIELRINFPNIATAIFALARVAWIKKIGKSRRYEVGAQFIEIEESLHKMISEHIDFVQGTIKKKSSLFSRLFFKK